MRSVTPDTAMRIGPRPARLLGLDLARSIAMLLALATHAIVAVGGLSGGIPLVFEAVLRLATPTFIALFGAMIAIVHLPRRERDGVAMLWRKSLSRAIQCYLLYALNVASLLVAGSFGPVFAIACLLFVGSTPYAGILRYYVVIYLALPIIVAAARALPVWVLVGAAATVHLAYPLLLTTPPPPPIGGGPFLERLTDFGLGIGDELAGPSIVHSLALLFLGFWLGTILRRRGSGTRPVRGEDAAIVAIVAGMIAYSVFACGPIDVSDLGTMRLRNLNHPGYVFLTGGIALAALAILGFAVRRQTLPDWMLLLSRRSLFAFGFGNALIALWPTMTAAYFGQAASAALLLLAVLALIWAYDHAMTGSGGRIGGFVRDTAARMTRAIDMLAARIVVRFAPAS